MKETEAQSLLDLLGRRPSRIELDRAALEIARIEYPDVDADACITELDHHALAIAERARDLSDGRSFVEAANEYLFVEAGFRGNSDEYYHPDNSCLNRVLETRLGIPITLSVIYMEIARRLSKPVSGVGLPGHFLVRYDDPEYAALIDPYHGGALLNVEQCCELAQVETLDQGMLDPVDRRHIAMRMINNLRGAYFARKETAKALRVLDLLIEAAPTSPDEHKQRAVALLQEHRMNEALEAFRRYLELSPEAPDREGIEEQIHNIAFWIASRN
ncbi:MAG: transglutaminase-like domain-containing protein [Acidobacteriota bacterium]|nr:transglutaminase-like domain-containing protein [Acidobacteriota bacterium]